MIPYLTASYFAGATLGAFAGAKYMAKESEDTPIAMKMAFITSGIVLGAPLGGVVGVFSPLTVPFLLHSLYEERKISNQSHQKPSKVERSSREVFF